VDNVRLFTEKAQSAGARVIIPPTSLPDGGEMAVLHDPQGMSFGVVKKS
jgi:predicted enzyme related to lactoylglutathione lyase